MDYSKNYYDYISYVKSLNRKRVHKRSSSYIYYEEHHIIPKCIGGGEDPNNKVLLTPREHFLAHYLLWKMYPSEPGIIFAFCSFSMQKNPKHGLRYINSRLIEQARDNKNEALSKLLREKFSAPEVRAKRSRLVKGERNPMFGTVAWNRGMKRSQETKDKISNTKKKQHAEKSVEERRKMTECMKHENLSPEAKERKRRKASEANKGSNNPMFGRSVYSLWVERYGKEEADRRQAAATAKRLAKMKAKRHLQQKS